MKLVPINEIFDIEYGNQFDLNKLSILTDASEGIAFVSRTSKKNGVVAKVAPYLNVKPYPRGRITVTLGGTYLLSSFVQQKPFYTAQNIKVLTPKHRMSLKEKLFYCTAIGQNRFRYTSHGREANKTFDTIPVPNRKEVRKLVSKYVIPKKPSNNSCVKRKLKLSDRTWEWFKYKDIFEIKGGYYNKKPVTSQSGTIPLIGATEYNNGVTSWHDRADIKLASKTGNGRNHSLKDKIWGGCIHYSK